MISSTTTTSSFSGVSEPSNTKSTIEATREFVTHAHKQLSEIIKSTAGRPSIGEGMAREQIIGHLNQAKQHIQTALSLMKPGDQSAMLPPSAVNPSRVGSIAPSAGPAHFTSPMSSILTAQQNLSSTMDSVLGSSPSHSYNLLSNANSWVSNAIERLEHEIATLSRQ